MDVVTFLKDYLRITTLSRAQAKVLRETFGTDPEKVFFAVEQVILKIGQGGGKNFTITPLVVYAIYLWCCLTDPHKFFNLYYYEPFDILNYSQVNEKQARNVFFKTLSAQMKQTIDPKTDMNWFVTKMRMRISEYGSKDILERSMEIPNRDPNRGGIRVFCLDTEAKSVEGYTIWMTIMDEPSRANTPVKYERAKAQYKTAFTNQKTRHAAGRRLTIVFAYPEQETNDLLAELFDEYSMEPAENKMEVHEGVLTAWYYNWVFSGKDRKEKKLEYKKDYKVDPIDADRRYKAIVPPNIYGFFMPHQQKIRECANPSLVSAVSYKTTLTRRKAVVSGVEKDVDFTALELFKINGDERERHWGGDFSLSKDRLVLVSGYAEKMDRPMEEFTYKIYEKESGKPITKAITINSRPIIDTILIWTPQAGKPIDYQNVEDIIIDLMGNSFPNSRSLHFDKWNTESIRQKLLDIGISDCETLQFSNPQQLLYGRLFRHLVWSNAMEYLHNDLLIGEMNKLMLLNNAKLDHPTSGSKDIWDAISICNYNIIMKTHRGVGLDIGDQSLTGEAAQRKQEAEDIQFYQQAYQLYLKREGHPPENLKAMREFMIKVMNYRVTIEKLSTMRQSWLDWADDVNNNVIGLDRYKDYTGERGILDMDQSLLQDLNALKIDEL